MADNNEAKTGKGAAGKRVAIIGGGLAGCECALTLAKAGAQVRLFEMRPGKSSPAHTTEHLAEKLGGAKWQRELVRMIEKGEKKGKMVIVDGGK